MVVAKQAGEAHFYLMEVQAGRTIDGRHKSNIARLINTSCAPNCRTHKWTSAATGMPTPSFLAALIPLPCCPGSYALLEQPLSCFQWP